MNQIPMTPALTSEQISRPAAPTFHAFVADKATHDALSRSTAHLGLATADCTDVIGFHEAMACLAEIATPEILVMDLTGAEDFMQAVDQLADVCAPGTRLICLGDVNDITLYRHLMALGVTEYLAKPVSDTALRDALETALAPPQQVASAPSSPIEPPETAKTGHVHCVVGSRGGVGSSTIAVNLAASLAHKHTERRVVLVDLDLQFGAAALMLDVEPGQGFVEALSQPERIDSLFLERSAVKTSKNMFVLAAEADLAQPLDARRFDLSDLFELLKASFNHIVVDVPRSGFLPMAGISDDIIIVSDPSLLGVRDALRLKRLVGTGPSEARAITILNRRTTASQGELDTKALKKIDDLQVDLTIPADPKFVLEAMALGKPLVRHRAASKTSKAINRLAEQLTGVPPQTSSAGLLNRLGQRLRAASSANTKGA